MATEADATSKASTASLILMMSLVRLRRPSVHLASLLSSRRNYRKMLTRPMSRLMTLTSNHTTLAFKSSPPTDTQQTLRTNSCEAFEFAGGLQGDGPISPPQGAFFQVAQSASWTLAETLPPSIRPNYIRRKFEIWRPTSGRSSNLLMLKAQSHFERRNFSYT